MQIYFIIFMCDLCEFQEKLDYWIRANINDEFTVKDAKMFACRASSVIKSLADNHFDVSPMFDETYNDENDIEGTKFVCIIGERNDEFIQVNFFCHRIVMYSSMKVYGMDAYTIPNKFCNYSIVFNCESMDNWEFETSRFFEKILKMHRKYKRRNLKINKKTFQRAGKFEND